MNAIIVIFISVIFVFCAICALVAVSDEREKRQAAKFMKEEIEMAKVIGYGAEGTEVMEAQKLLQAYGSKIKADGKFTIGMVSAVKAFQKKHNLSVTGAIDSKTITKLKTYAKPAKKSATKATKTAKVKTVK